MILEQSLFAFVVPFFTHLGFSSILQALSVDIEGSDIITEWQIAWRVRKVELTHGAHAQKSFSVVITVFK